MSCAVAISNSPPPPVFSPLSSRVFCNCKRSSSSSSSPETLSLTTHSSSSSSSSSPTSPLRLHRIQKQPSSLFRSSSDSGPASILGSGSISPTPVLKRKRPARLDIPLMGSTGLWNNPVTPSVVEGREVEREGDGYGVYCKRGRRENLEDRFCARVGVDGDPKQAFFGIFDGHGGAKAAKFAADKLGEFIFDELNKRDENQIEDAIKYGYLKTDTEFLREELRGGTCCVTALIRRGNLVVSNAGDCRAVMSRGGIAEALTSDHRPSRTDEKDRIEKLGGYVDCCANGVWRIQGSLAVSRGIGDRHLKQWITAEPETKVIRLKSDYEFLILASDGLWDKVTNQEAVDIARPLCVGTHKPEPLLACKKLVDLSGSRGSSDDTSVMLIQLGRIY